MSIKIIKTKISSITCKSIYQTIIIYTPFNYIVYLFIDFCHMRPSINLLVKFIKLNNVVTTVLTISDTAFTLGAIVSNTFAHNHYRPFAFVSRGLCPFSYGTLRHLFLSNQVFKKVI